MAEKIKNQLVPGQKGPDRKGPERLVATTSINKKLYDGPFDFVEKRDHSVIPPVLSATAVGVYSIGPDEEGGSHAVLNDADDPSASDIVFAVLISRFAYDQNKHAELIATNGDIYYIRCDYLSDHMPPLTAEDRDVIRKAVAEFETE